MKITYKSLEAKLAKLNKISHLSKKDLSSFEEWINVELTYSSNAIEGNSLTRIETAEVIEKGVKANIPGKPLNDLLEARNHDKALKYILDLANRLKSHQFIIEEDVLKIHHLILSGINDDWTGKYRKGEIFVRGSNSRFPMPEAVPALMKDFFEWIKGVQDENPVKIASDAHYKFVSIHPFVDGNGRCARLLMNTILKIHGYPMAVIANEDRSKYLASLEKAQTTNNLDDFYDIIKESVNNTLDMYINFLENKEILKSKNSDKFFRIGELSQKTNETIHTLHYWIKEGLIKPKNRTKGGYQLFGKDAIEKINKIRNLQKTKRLTLSEIKNVFNRV